MTSIEFYINDKLIDITDADKLGIRLDKLIFKPAEFTSSDKQKSYTITIPNTPTNNEIFNFANIEEVKNKFNYEYDAKVYVDFILIFDGKFMLSEITENTYKGNLYIPAYKSVKDIFGDRVMNAPTSNADLNKWILPITSATDISTKNTTALINYSNNIASDCLFPFILYGLIPKVPINPNVWYNGEQTGDYTDKDLYDRFARLGYEDIPPSMNVLKTIKHLFSANGLSIGGTAFNDDRLKHLYMSYNNPTDYNQEWNWGDLGSIGVNGSWSMADKNGTNYSNFERQINQDSDNYGLYYSTNLFDCNRSNLTYTDTGTNVIYTEFKDKYTDKDYTRKNLSITIPKSGYYKISLSGSINLNNDGEHLRFWDNGNRFTSTRQSHSNRNNRFDRSMYEIQIMRDYGEGDFNAGNIVGKYKEPNFPQTSFDDKNQLPKYYPYAGGAMVIDPQTNQNFICGLHWGRHDDDYNPQDGGTKANYMFIQNGWSYNRTFTKRQKILSVYNSSYNGDEFNYHCYGTNDDGDTETDLGDDDIANPQWYKAIRRKGILNNLPNTNYVTSSGDVTGNGRVQSVIWLDKGEHISINVVGHMGDMRRGSSHKSEFDGWVTLIDSVTFDLKIEPFRTDLVWNNFDTQGNYNSGRLLSWNDVSNFQKGYIDLCNFLPSEIKINDFLDNFCKAFNLNLVQPNKGRFELNVKQTKALGTSDIVDFEDKFNIKLRSNEPLGLPSEINIKWNIDEDEQGFVETGFTGNGLFTTGTINGTVTEQSSTFSYNWFKPIRFKQYSDTSDNDTNAIIQDIPIISKREVWDVDSSADYSEMQKKWYVNLPIRFFYPDNLLGIEAGYSNSIFRLGSNPVKLLRVKGEYNNTNIMILNYENKEHSILNNYFTIITTNDSNYTIIETYLTPDEYDMLDGRNMVKLNSDLYYVSSVDGYDPLMKTTSKIKLIRKV